jgi:4-amino-4-deoxy-L-arabinose transferase-like glycosyltransferase
MHCAYCGKKINGDSEYCSYCGKNTAVLKPVQNTAQPDRPAEDAGSAYEDYRTAFAPGLFEPLKQIGSIPFFAVAFLFALFGQKLMFNNNKSVVLGLCLFAAGILFFAAAEFSRRRETVQEAPAKGMKLKYEIVLFSLVVLVSVFFRTYNSSVIPSGFFYDEASYGDAALKIIHNQPVNGQKLPVYITGDINHAAYYIYVVGAVFKTFGAGITQERMTAALMGILGTVAFYFLLRSVFGALPAFFGGILFASTRWHFIFSRVAFPSVFGVFISIVCIYAAWITYKHRKTSGFFLFGLAAGLVPYTYTPARMIYPALLVFMAFIAVRDRKFYTENVPKIVLAAVVFLITFLPLGTVFLLHPQEFMTRTNQVSILDKNIVNSWFGGRFTVQQALKDTFEKTMLMFNHIGDFNPRHNLPGYPMLDFLTGTAAFLGLGFAVINLFNPANFMFVSLFIFFLLPGLLTIEAPQSHRILFEVPVVIFFASLFLHKMIIYAKEQYKGRLHLPVIIIAGVFVAAAAIMNYNVYFNRQVNNSSCWSSFNTLERTTFEYIKSKGEGWRGVIEPDIMDNRYRSFRFLMEMNKMTNYDVFDENLSVPIHPQPGISYVYLLFPERKNVVEFELKKLYPNGKEVPIYNGGDKNIIEMIAYEVPAQDAAAMAGAKIKNGLTAMYYAGYKWEGAPVITRTDPIIYFDWHITPIAGYFSAVWKGRLDVEKSGEYVFYTRSNNYALLKIDGVAVIENKIRGGLVEASGKTRLRAGRHLIEVKYSEDTGYSKMQLLWQPPGATVVEPVPNEVLFPE